MSYSAESGVVKKGKSHLQGAQALTSTSVTYAEHTSLLISLSLVYFSDLYVCEAPTDITEKGNKRKLKFLFTKNSYLQLLY